MSDCGSGSGSLTGSTTDPSTRMLERRVSNNRADLNGDQQMNYFLSWFTQWSDLQKADFVPVLAAKQMGAAKANGTNDDGDALAGQFVSMDIRSSRPPSLFTCQVKLFHDWFSGWSDDQKNYLVMRLQDIDQAFFQKYDNFVQNPKGAVAAEKDYFEPGIPAELIKNGSGSSSLNAIKEDVADAAGAGGDCHEVSAHVDVNAGMQEGDDDLPLNKSVGAAGDCDVSIHATPAEILVEAEGV